MSSEQTARSVAEQLAAEQLAVETRRNRRTALVALRGELDLLTVSKVAEDVFGLKELIRQNEFARSNHHNLALVRGTAAIHRVLELTGVDDVLVLVDDPDDLVPPPVTH